MARERAQGRLKITVTYRDGANLATSETVTREVLLPGSALIQGNTQTGNTAPGAEPEDDGAGWGALREAEIPLEDLLPDDLLADITKLRQWTRWSIAEITIEAEGGARIVDMCVYEEPLAAAFEANDDALPLHGVHKGQGPGFGANQYPMQRASEKGTDGDPRLGTWWTQEVNDAIGEIGPCLVSWCAWREETAVYNDTETDATTTSTGWLGVMVSGYGSWDEDHEGWSLAGGAHARRHGPSDEHIVLPNTGVIPVRVNVLASITANTGTVRVQSGPESWVDVEIDSTSTAWHTALGYLRCDRGPDDDRPLQPYFKTASGDTLSVRAISVHYEEHGPALA